MGARTVAGVDGFRGGWVVAIHHSSLAGTGSIQLVTAESFAEVLELTSECAAVGVDMPLALPAQGVRESDALVKEFLGRAGRSLFWTPTRSAVDAASHAEAVRVNKSLGGKGPSAQGWGLAARIREVRAALLPVPDARVFEAHPESSFALLHAHHENAQSHPEANLLASKKSARGVAQRMLLVDNWVPGVTEAVASLPAGPMIDDALDAIAAAWTAGRVVDRRAQWFGATVVDDQGFTPAVAV